MDTDGGEAEQIKHSESVTSSVEYSHTEGATAIVMDLTKPRWPARLLVKQVKQL